MATIKCPNCSDEYPSRFPKCPQCCQPNPEVLGIQQKDRKAVPNRESEVFRIRQGGVESGPFTLFQLKSMWGNGAITAGAFFKSGSEDWKSIIELSKSLEGAESSSSEQKRNSGVTLKVLNCIVVVAVVGLVFVLTKMGSHISEKDYRPKAKACAQLITMDVVTLAIEYDQLRIALLNNDVGDIGEQDMKTVIETMMRVEPYKTKHQIHQTTKHSIENALAELSNPPDSCRSLHAQLLADFQSYSELLETNRRAGSGAKDWVMRNEIAVQKATNDLMKTTLLLH